MNNKKIEFEKNVLLSVQKALLGEIYKDIRAIVIGFHSKELKLIYYLDRLPIDDDFESISFVTTEIIADFPENTFDSIYENCIYNVESIRELDKLDAMVYCRKEY